MGAHCGINPTVIWTFRAIYAIVVFTIMSGVLAFFAAARWQTPPRFFFAGMALAFIAAAAPVAILALLPPQRGNWVFVAWLCMLAVEWAVLKTVDHRKKTRGKIAEQPPA